jgi:hypothetical protein
MNTRRVLGTTILAAAALVLGSRLGGLSAAGADAGPATEIRPLALPAAVAAGLPGQAIAVGDLDGDRRDDLVLAGAPDQATRQVTVRLAGGALQTVRLWPGQARPATPELFDVDGDGLDDLVLDLADGDELGLAVLRGRADGLAGRSLAGPDEADLWIVLDERAAPDHTAVRAVWGELDGDGAMDLVAHLDTRPLPRWADEGQDALMLGAGRLRGRQAFRADVRLRGRCGQLATPADATGDGLADLLTETCNRRLALLPGRHTWPAELWPGGDAAWSLRTDGQLGGGATPLHLALADADGDGVADILAGNGDTIYVWPGGEALGRRSRFSGTSTLLIQAPLAVRPSSRDWRPADWNGDGRLDFPVRAGDGSTTRLFLGRPSMPQVLDAAVAPADALLPAGDWLASGDFDGDGATDALLRGTDGPGYGILPGRLGLRARWALPEALPGCDFCPGAELAMTCDVGLAEPAASPAQYYPPGRAPVFLPLALAEGEPLVVTALPPRTATPTLGTPATPTATGEPSETATPTETPSQTPTDETPTPTATPTDEPDWDTITFPNIPVRVLGTCSAEVHDRYAVTGPDGLKYRTWHAETVLVNPDDPSQGSCTFRHEHGDDPRQGSFAEEPPPPFGYVSRLANDYAMIAAHGGYKVAYHGRDQPEGIGAEWRLSMHQGTMGVGRLNLFGHEIQLDIVESPPEAPLRRTSVRVQGDTGRLSPACGPRIGDRVVPDKACAQRARMYEVWYTLVYIGKGQATGAAFTALPGFATSDAMTYLDPADMTKVFSASELIESGLPQGDPRSQYLGNTHLIEHPDFGWGNTGPETFWTDVTGRSLSPAAAAACTHLTCLQQLVPSGYHAVSDLDINFTRPRYELPEGAWGN